MLPVLVGNFLETMMTLLLILASIVAVPLALLATSVALLAPGSCAPRRHDPGRAMPARQERGSRHHLIVVADVEGFGDPRRTGPHQRAVRDGLYAMMTAAFAAAGLVWEDCYHEDRGDAVFVLVPAEADKAVFVEAALPALVTRLRVHNDTHPESQRIRLRVALHAGEVGYDTHGVTSASLTLAFRLNDAPPLKAALAASPGVLAVIASDWFFDDVVRHTPGAAPATWRPFVVTVKESDTTGWVTLPDHPYLPDGRSRTPPRRLRSVPSLSLRDRTT